jgi:hypothetical protein
MLRRRRSQVATTTATLTAGVVHFAAKLQNLQIKNPTSRYKPMLSSATATRAHARGSHDTQTAARRWRVSTHANVLAPDDDASANDGTIATAALLHTSPTYMVSTHTGRHGASRTRRLGAPRRTM